MSAIPSKLIVECPLCHAPYDKTRVRLVREREGSRLFHCSCHVCGRSMLAFMLESAGWLSTVGLVTDLEVADAMRLEDATPIAANECIRLHHAIYDQSQTLCQKLLS